MPIKIPQSGLAAHYRSTNGGLIMPDRSRYGTNVTLVGCPNRLPHAKGFATTMPGTSAQTGTTAPLKSWIDPNGGNKMSCFAWIYWTQSMEAYNAIVEKYTAAVGYSLIIKSNGQLCTYIQGSSIANIDGSGQIMVVNKWYHVGFTYDGTTLRNYVNGVQDASSTQTTTIGASPSDNLKIGYSRFGLYRYFRGSLDDVMIYNRALRHNEVQKIYIQTRRN